MKTLEKLHVMILTLILHRTVYGHDERRNLRLVENVILSCEK